MGFGTWANGLHKDLWAIARVHYCVLIAIAIYSVHTGNWAHKVNAFSFAGTSFGMLPSASALASLGLGPSTTPAIHWPIPSSVESAGKPVVIAPGLPGLKKGLIDSILAGQYIDFTELPPAKGRTKALNSMLDGQVVLLQTSDFLQAKRLIPDLGIWIQCFSLYMAVILTKQPERATSLLLYQSSIAKLSQKFKWPAWVIYDNSYRQEAADSAKLDWAKIDLSLHAQCFTGMAISSEGWCSLCHSVEHLKHNCPLNSQGGLQDAASHQQSVSKSGHQYAENSISTMGIVNSCLSATTGMCALSAMALTRRPGARWLLGRPSPSNSDIVPRLLLILCCAARTYQSTLYLITYQPTLYRITYQFDPLPDHLFISCVIDPVPYCIIFDCS